MKKRRVVDIIEELINKFIETNDGYELVDIEFVKEGKHRYLRVFMDKEDGISIDDCQEISRYLTVKLDELDPIEENYFLEVSSPGIERPLKKDSDFERFIDELIEVKLYSPIDGQKIIDGHLKGLKDKIVSIKREGTNEIIQIPRDKIASAKLLFRF